MNSKPNCVVITRDKVLSQKIAGYLGLRANLDFVTPDQQGVLPPSVGKTAILLLDLRLWQSIGSLREEIHSGNVDFIIGLGNQRSDPAIQAVSSGISRIVSLDPDRLELQGAVAQAHKHLLTKLELTAIKENREGHAPVETAESELDDIFRLTRTLQNLGDTQAVYKQTVEVATHTMSTPRVALYLVSQDGASYVCRAFLASQGIMARANVSGDSQIVLSLRTKGHLLSRQYLHEVGEADAMLALSDFLDATGTDVLAPLFGANTFLGWLAVGKKATGRALAEEDFSRLTALVAALSPILESAIEIEKNNLQMKLLESLLRAIPTGIIAIGAKGTVQWMNAGAEKLLNVRFQSVLGLALVRVSSPLAELSRNVLEQREEDATHLCMIREGLPVEVRLVRQNGSADAFGVLLLLEDASEREHLRVEREKVRRSELLADISVDVSTRIRSPLTTIKTFAQLLPELFDDKNFCNQFSEVVTGEINRLDELATNIATIGKLTQPSPVKQSVIFSLEELLKTAMCLSGEIWQQVELKIASDFPMLRGNPERLGEALFHLIANAADSISDLQQGCIVISAQKVLLGKKMEVVEISVLDNRPVKKVGEFIDHSNLGSHENISRADLRLSIATQIVHEAAGTIHLKTYDRGACIKLLLPINGENT